MIGFSPRYDRALAFAAQVHQNQLRKGTPIPYIAHVVHVSVILIRHGFDEDLAVAGLLHDAVEDQQVPIAQIAAEFGSNVARLVEAVSERKTENGLERSWEERKAEKLAHLRTGGPEVAALKAADCIHNARSIQLDLATHGPGVWSRFKRGPESLLWYYRETLNGVQAALGNHPIVLELAETVDEFEQVTRVSA